MTVRLPSVKASENSLRLCNADISGNCENLRASQLPDVIYEKGDRRCQKRAALRNDMPLVYLTGRIIRQGGSFGIICSKSGKNVIE